MIKSKFQIWQERFREIESEIQNLCLNQKIYKQVRRIISKNKELRKGNIFYGFLSCTYSSHMVLGVRRLVKRNKRRGISFLDLLEDIHAHPEEISLERFKAAYQEHESLALSLAENDFRQFNTGNNKHICSQKLIEDIHRMKEDTKNVIDFSDKHVAHLDNNRSNYLSTFNDLSKAVGTIEELGCKYRLLLTGQYSCNMTPVIQDHWEEIFQLPWIAEE